MSLAFCLPPIPPGGCGTVDTATFATGRIHKQFSEDNFSWKATVDWKLTYETMLYASGSRGYKAGNFVNLTAVFSESFDPVPQEKINAYELGCISKMLENRLNVDLAGFYSEQVHKQLRGYRNGSVLG